MTWTAATMAKGSPVPLYHQLAELIRERIRAGELAPGDQLPAERDLAETVGISRMTARQAVASLVRDGTLVARPGIGTFVATPKLTYDALHLLGFTEETMRHGDAVASRVLEQALASPPAPVATGLALPPGETAIKVVRLRSAGDLPVLLETSFLPALVCPGLEREDLARHSLYALLELRYGLRLERSRQTIEATIANDYESGLLGVEVGAPMLLLEGLTYDDGGRPVEHFKAIYRADRSKFALESKRQSGGLAAADAPQVSLVLT